MASATAPTSRIPPRRGTSCRVPTDLSYSRQVTHRQLRQWCSGISGFLTGTLDSARMR